MFKAIIKNLLNVQTNSGVFETEEMAHNWIYETRLTGAFGPDGEFTTEVVDITELKIQEAKEFKAAKKISFGTAMRIYLNALQTDKIDNGIWTPAILGSFLSNADVALIERFLGFGALTYAKAKIEASDLSEFYTVPELTAISDKLNGYISQLGE